MAAPVQKSPDKIIQSEYNKFRDEMNKSLGLIYKHLSTGNTNDAEKERNRFIEIMSKYFLH